MVNAVRKGSQFERDAARSLSEWWTGHPRALVRTKLFSRSMENLLGDVVPNVNPNEVPEKIIKEALAFPFMVDAKARDKEFPDLDALFNKKCPVYSWWGDLARKAGKAKKFPLLVPKVRGKVYAITDLGLSSLPRTIRGTTFAIDGYRGLEVFCLWRFDEFLSLEKKGVLEFYEEEYGNSEQKRDGGKTAHGLPGAAAVRGQERSVAVGDRRDDQGVLPEEPSERKSDGQGAQGVPAGGVEGAQADGPPAGAETRGPGDEGEGTWV